MAESDILIKLILSVVFGAILGLETDTREIEQKGEIKAERDELQRLGGFRTYTLISLFGGIAGIFYVLGSIGITYILFSALIILITSAYYLNVKLKKAFGLTTEVAIIITFTLGFLTTSGLVRFEILLGILALMAFFLSQKRGIGKFIKKIQHKELIDVIKFGLVSLILLPILPNLNFQLNDVLRIFNLSTIGNASLGELYIINPFQVWLIVVLISGVNLLAYFLSRAFGTKNGITMTGFLGGFFSSTSTLISFAGKSKSLTNISLIKRYAGGAVLSNGFSYVLVAILFLLTDVSLFYVVFPSVLIMFFISVIYGLTLIYSKNTSTEDIDHGIVYQSFSLGPALKFVSLIVIITLLIQVMQLFRVNDTLIVLVTALSGITGIDAPVIAISNLTKSGDITLGIGILTFTLTNIINLTAKSIYSRTLGNRIFFRYILTGMILTTVAGILGLLMI